MYVQNVESSALVALRLLADNGKAIRGAVAPNLRHPIALHIPPEEDRKATREPSGFRSFSVHVPGSRQSS